MLKTFLNHIGYKQQASFNDLSKGDQKKFLYGIRESFPVRRRRKRSVQEFEGRWIGLIPLAEKWYDKYINSLWVEESLQVLKVGECSVCHGSRLKEPFCHVTVSEKDIGEVTAMTVGRALEFFNQIKLSKREQTIGQQILREIRGRLAFLNSVGLDYIGLNRVGHTLSGGEAQRIRLASQIGSGLEGVLYVLDEPTVGLHQKDTEQLVSSLYKLRELGNTVVVVEHDPEMIEKADWIVDMGPKAGEFGGEVVAVGTPAKIKANKKSLTGKYLSGKLKMDGYAAVKEKAEAFISIKGAGIHNLKNLNCKIPLNRLVTFCGVSGSGKSSLVFDVLVESALASLSKQPHPQDLCAEFSLPKEIDQIISVDQSPLGSSPRSNPVTYGKVFDKIRELFASMPEAKVKGFSKSRFSMNTGKGRCAGCEGMGSIKMEMHFISDIWVTCDACKGMRYNSDTLKVTFKGKTIADVLAMRVEEAVTFFIAQKAVHRYLQTLIDVGLGYLKLGQASTTFSGGEAQRIKLAAELARGTRRHNLYVFDEPTTGLHLADIHRLMDVLKRLVEKGYSVLVVEHQMNVIQGSDWLIELGPSGGEAGGQLLFQGIPKDIKTKKTPTAISLKNSGTFVG